MSRETNAAVKSFFDDIEMRAAAAFSEANKNLAEALIQEAKWLSSGVHKEKELIAMDYPFAKRHGQPGLETSVLNRQSGGDSLFNKWSKRRISMDKNRVVSYEIFNRAFYASYLEHGTTRMFARDLLTPLETFAQGAAPAILQRAFAKQGF